MKHKSSGSFSFLSIEQMDVSSKYFFSLEKKNGQKRFMHSLRSEAGVILSSHAEYEPRACGFYETCTRMSGTGWDTESAVKQLFVCNFYKDFCIIINKWLASCYMRHFTQN